MTANASLAPPLTDAVRDAPTVELALVVVSATGDRGAVVVGPGTRARLTGANRVAAATDAECAAAAADEEKEATGAEEGRVAIDDDNDDGTDAKASGKGDECCVGNKEAVDADRDAGADTVTGPGEMEKEMLGGGDTPRGGVCNNGSASSVLMLAVFLMGLKPLGSEVHVPAPVFS